MQYHSDEHHADYQNGWSKRQRDREENAEDKRDGTERLSLLSPNPAY